MITSPITFAASANCAVYVGATPVFADIDPETYNIDPASIEAHITDKTKAVVAVAYTGQSVDYARIQKICDKHGLTLITDAAHAIGTKYNGQPVGSIGDMTCFSFHPVKTVTSGEGGAITTNDPELFRKLKLASQHGIVRNADEFVHEADGIWYYEMQELGFNYRLAGLGISQACGRQDNRIKRSKTYHNSF